MTNDYQEALKTRFRAMREALPPSPWQRRPSVAVGGLQALGFSEDSRHLLVVSHAGRGVFVAATGERIARDSTPAPADGYDTTALTVEGIGPLSGQRIRLAGLHGGGLPRVTTDLWTADLLCPDWPEGFVTLSSPEADPWTEGRTMGVTRIAPIGGADVVRCFGFSWSGRHLIVATSHTFDLFVR